jgi:tetratricopeptide (TPR) repeat protein
MPAKGFLISFAGTTDDRSLGLAYAEIGDQRAADLLRRVGTPDVETQLRLAFLESSVPRYEAVLRLDPNRTVALVNLGTLYAREGRLREAATLWQHALKTNPGVEEAALNLAAIQSPGEARRTLTAYLSLNPGSSAALTRLLRLQ